MGCSRNIGRTKRLEKLTDASKLRLSSATQTSAPSTTTLMQTKMPSTFLDVSQPIPSFTTMSAGDATRKKGDIAGELPLRGMTPVNSRIEPRGRLTIP